MKNTFITWTPDALRALSYSPEQQATIDTAVSAIDPTDRFISYYWSDRLVQRGMQTFAVFGSAAYEVIRFTDADDEGTRYEYLPMLVNGRMLLEAPDEGRTGVIYLMRRTHRRGEPNPTGWMTTSLSAGWLHTRELDMNNDAIMDNIADDISRGENVLIRKPAGWA